MVSDSDLCPVVVVIGAGISGLTCAYRINDIAHRNGNKVKVVVLDKANRAGGVIESEQVDGALLERGPDSFLSSKAAIMELIEELGLSDNLTAASPNGRKTLIASRQRLHALPEGFVLFAPTRMSSLAASPLFSLAGKLRMALDLVIPRRQARSDESLAGFVQRRLGQEALDRLAEPLIAGIYSGNPEMLSASATVPMLHEMEQEFGSIIRGLWHRTRRMKKHQTTQSKQATPTAQFLSFDSGMQLLVNTLLKRLPQGTLQLGTDVDRIVQGEQKRWSVICSDSKSIDADAVIVATPAPQASKLIGELDPDSAARLANISYNSTFIVNALFKRSNMPVDLNASGFVVPSIENKALRACTFSSIKFPNRAPKDTVVLRLYARDGRQAGDDLIPAMIQEVQELLDFKAAPIMVQASAHPNALPQYTIGHAERMEQLQTTYNCIHGLGLAGNAYMGIGIPDCINSANLAVNKIMPVLQFAQV